jgi:Bacterial RNA polymerase, alpha chain C terminal domain/Mrr N-terminal domain
LTKSKTCYKVSFVTREKIMMPVIRISEETYAHLQRHAKPFEDTTPESVIIKALAALDMMDGDVPVPAKTSSPRRNETPKLPQREFRLPLLMAISKFGGRAHAKDVRALLGPVMAPKLLEGDLENVSTGDPRWWNAVCWERSDLVKDGLMRADSDRGVWEMSDEGRNLPAALLDGTADRMELAAGPLAEMAAKYWTGELSNVAVMVGDSVFDPILFKTWDEMELTVRSCNCLRNAGVHHLGDLVQMTEQDLLYMPNMGRKALVEIKDALAVLNLKVDTKLPGGPVKFADLAPAR